MKYLVIIESTETGYSAYVPDLPGCINVGETREDAEANIHEAILLHLEGLKEDGQEIPKPTTDAVSMIVPKVA